METLLNQLRELLKHYTVASNVAMATGKNDDVNRAIGLLQEINAVRLSVALNAEMREIFYKQVNVPQAASANTVQNIYVSQNDKRYTFRRGIAALIDNVTISFLNQGARAIEITRNPVAWQMLFSQYQNAAPIGQQSLFDFPETLMFSENQSLNIGITGQTDDGFLFFHGANIKDNLEESSIADIRREFLTDSGQTLYLPETQIVPLQFKFTSNTAGTLATTPNGDNNIFSVKSDKSVLLLEVSSNRQDYIIDKLTDEGRNQTICERIETLGVAGNSDNQYAAWYPLPEPHLLRRGDRLKAVLTNGSNISGDTVAANDATTLAFRGITL
jgi:hypothetical protein